MAEIILLVFLAHSFPRFFFLTIGHFFFFFFPFLYLLLGKGITLTLDGIPPEMFYSRYSTL